MKSKSQIASDLYIKNPELSVKELMKLANCSQRLAYYAINYAKSFESPSGVKKEDKTKGDVRSITTTSSEIRTLEELILFSDIDLTKWEITKHVINSWGSTKNESFQVKVWLKRKTPQVRALEHFIQNIKPKVHKLNYLKHKNEILHEISIFDHHFGKFAWKDETGENFDLKIGKKRFVEAVCSLSDRVVKPNRILFTVGNDILHINTEANTTFRGTVQDVDTRLAKIFVYAFETIVDTIFTLSKIAPVDILWIGSNHDLETSYFLCFSIAQYFKHDNRVNVDISPRIRKAYQWGKNSIFFDHGEIKPEKIVNILSTEFPKEWCEAEWRECHAAHLHKKMEMIFTTADTYGSLIYRRIPSLTGTDSWHYRSGFICSPKAAQSFEWDKYEGQIGQYNHNLKGE